MRVKVISFKDGRRIYRKQILSEQAVFNIYCFLCGVIVALMIAIANGVV